MAGRVLVCGNRIPVSTSFFIQPSPLFLCVWKPSPWIKYKMNSFEDHQLIYMRTPYFPIRSHSQILRVRTWAVVLGNTIQPAIVTNTLRALHPHFSCFIMCFLRGPAGGQGWATPRDEHGSSSKSISFLDFFFEKILTDNLKHVNITINRLWYKYTIHMNF